MTDGVEIITLAESTKDELADKCACGGWLILAGYSYFGPTSYLIRRKCVCCGVWDVTENTR